MRGTASSARPIAPADPLASRAVGPRLCTMSTSRAWLAVRPPTLSAVTNVRGYEEVKLRNVGLQRRECERRSARTPVHGDDDGSGEAVF